MFTLAGCGGRSAVHVSVPTPAGATATACAGLMGRLPDDLVTSEHRRATVPSSPYTAAFGSPAVVVLCGTPVRKHDPTSNVVNVDGVDWLQLPPKGSAQDFMSYQTKIVVEVVIPTNYLPADILPPLSGLVAAASKTITS